MDALRQALMVCFIVSYASAQVVLNGCPSYGCNPRGTFSLPNPIPLGPDVNVKWIAELGSPLPELTTYGCVANHGQNIIVPVNTPSVVGYASYDPTTGNRTWADGVFRYPTLPIMDTQGDIIGCDGNNLALIKVNGDVVDPVITFWHSLKPVYNLMLTDNNVILIVSGNGMLLTYLSNGVVHASLFLNTTVNGVNGTYNPIAQPVLSGHRAYVLTEFVLEEASDKAKVHDVGPRLYSMDILRISAPRMNVTWFIDLTLIPEAQRKYTEKHWESDKRSDTEFNMATDRDEWMKSQETINKDVPLTSTPRVLVAANGHVFVMKQDWRNLTWYNFYDIIDNGWNASYEASFSSQYIEDISSDFLATHEHGFYIWLYSRKYGAITRFNYITKELSATIFLDENIFPNCELIFTSNLMVQAPVNATDTYKIIVGLRLLGPICKLKMAKSITTSTLGSGEHFLITLELIKQAPADDLYQPISVISTGEFAIRGQIVTYYSDGNNGDSKPTLVAVANNHEEVILLNVQ